MDPAYYTSQFEIYLRKPLEGNPFDTEPMANLRRFLAIEHIAKVRGSVIFFVPSTTFFEGKQQSMRRRSQTPTSSRLPIIRLSIGDAI